jgi:hypothetical protein
MKKGMKFVLIFLSLVLILMFTINVLAGPIEWFKELGRITGMAPSQTTTVTIGVNGTNGASIIYVTPVTALTPIELGQIAVRFNFTVYDLDGASDINLTATGFNISKPGEEIRVNITGPNCTWVSGQNTATTVNFTCQTQMWFYDSTGTWNISVRAKDLGNQTYAYNYTMNQLKAMVISPNALTWSSVSPGGTNKTSSNDPTVINNTGNYNGTISITAVNLLGDSDRNYAIYATNFSTGINSSGNSECNNGNGLLTNNSAFGVKASVSGRGNLTKDDGTAKEEIYYCIPVVPSNITSQTYSTTTLGSWTIAY